MCFHNSKQIYDDIRHSSHNMDLLPKMEKIFFATREMIANSAAITSSTVWRREMLHFCSEETMHIPIGDRARAIVASQFSNIGYIGEVMGVWRIHNNNSFIQTPKASLSDKLKIYDSFFNHYRLLNEYFCFEYDKIIKESLIKLYCRRNLSICRAYLKNFEWRDFIDHLCNAMNNQEIDSKRSFSKIILLYFKVILELFYYRIFIFNRILRNALLQVVRKFF